MVLTDHNTFEGVYEIRDIARNEFNNSFKVLLGVEWTTDNGHFNLIFPPNTTQEDFIDFMKEGRTLDRVNFPIEKYTKTRKYSIKMLQQSNSSLKYIIPAVESHKKSYLTQESEYLTIED